MYDDFIFGTLQCQIEGWFGINVFGSSELAKSKQTGVDGKFVSLIHNKRYLSLAK